MLFGHLSSLEYPEIEAIYDRFAALYSPSLNLGDQLLFHAWMNREGAALSMAANVAGIGSLCFEPETFLLKQALRAGVCDFVVHDLDEALRVQQNEVRKGRPVAIAVAGEPEIVIAEAVERGIQPHVVLLQQTGPDSRTSDIHGTEKLVAGGARRLVVRRPAEHMIDVHWSVAREPLRWLPFADALASTSLDPRERTTCQRRLWIENSPRYLGRHFAAQRFLPMTPDEADRFFNAVQRDVEGGEIQVAVSVVRNGEEELVLS
jgi:Urocanase Rossmann-like domain